MERQILLDKEQQREWRVSAMEEENVKISGRVNLGRRILATWSSELLSKEMYHFCYIHTKC